MGFTVCTQHSKRWLILQLEVQETFILKEVYFLLFVFCIITFLCTDLRTDIIPNLGCFLPMYFWQHHFPPPNICGSSQNWDFPPWTPLEIDKRFWNILWKTKASWAHWCLLFLFRLLCTLTFCICYIVFVFVFCCICLLLHCICACIVLHLFCIALYLCFYYTAFVLYCILFVFVLCYICLVLHCICVCIVLYCICV